MPGASSPPGLLHPWSSAIAPTLDRIRSTDRGSVRARNVGTAISRAHHFVAWAASKGFHDVAFANTPPADAGSILAVYAQKVGEGHSIKSTTQPHIKTIQGYVRAAAEIATSAGRDDPRFLSTYTDRDGKRPYVQLLAQVFETAKKWTPLKRPECMPITVCIIAVLGSAVSTSPGGELCLSALIRDAAILGTFTGSRVAEYAQASKPAGVAYSTVPKNPASGDQGGKAIAFIRDDFGFYSALKIEVFDSDVSAAAYIRVRFRYTKGSRNFVFRVFAAIPSSPFCPVQAGARVVRRWSALQVNPEAPLFCFRNGFFSRKPSFLSDTQMTAALRQAALKAYPSPNNIVHQQIKAIHSQSLRVFACLCLKLGGWDEEAISHQLRWNSDAVKYYIRQAPFQADAIGATLFTKALVI